MSSPDMSVCAIFVGVLEEIHVFVVVDVFILADVVYKVR